MNLMNNLKWIVAGIMVMGTATGICQQNGGPAGAANQQAQAADLAVKRADPKVNLFNGSFGYSIPIACAPARNGSQPSLALAYSSAAGGTEGNGWCGYGWSLDIGYIERNTKDGFPIAYSTATPPAPKTAYDDSKGFILNLFGKSCKLFPTGVTSSLGVEYRPEVDTDFLDCFLNTGNNLWTVYDTSGNAYYFGSTANGTSKMVNPKSNWGGYSGTFRWALDKVDTATGDETTVAYTTYTSPYTGVVEGTLYPTTITYNSHVNLNGYTAGYTGTHSIVFGLDPTLRPDYHFSYRSGFRTEQNRRLKTITSMVGTKNVWQYTLGYNQSPATGRSMLTTVAVQGYDTTGANPKSLPTKTFTYQANPNAVSFGNPIQWNGLILTTPDANPTSYEPWVNMVNTTGGFSYTVADLVDIDGDGLPDRVSWDDGTGSRDVYQVQRNLGLASGGGSGSFSTTRYAFGPTSTGSGSLSAANPMPDGSTGWGAAWSALNTAYGRIRDINGDGLPDRVMDNWASIDSVIQGTLPYTPYTSFDVMTNTGGGFSPVNDWSVSPGPISQAQQAAADYYCVESGGIYVGFFDINGDGLPDRVMSGYDAQGFPMTNFMVQLNTGSSFAQPVVFGPYKSQNYNGTLSGQNIPSTWAGIETAESHMIDINGDGLPDRVMYPMNSSGGELTAPVAPASTYYAVEYDNGYGFEAVNTSITVPGAADQWPGVYTQGNNGTTRYDAIENLPYVGLFDVNGDGLPDRVMVNQASVGNPNTSWLVYLNNGHGFNSTPITVNNIANQSQYNAATPDWWSMQGTYDGSAITSMIDINGDGLLDRVMAVYSSTGINTTDPYFLVQLNQGPYPDLLTNIDNGMGGVDGITYNSSTAYDNHLDPTQPNLGSRLPFPQQVVSSVTESDGINPPQTTTYGYGGGFYDGSRREFAGFAVVTNTDPTLRSTVTYFHTGGGRNYTALGEYNDAGSFAKRGMPYRIETWGNDSPTRLLYKVQVNQVDQHQFSYTSTAGTTYLRYFPYVSQSFEYDYPGGGSPRVTWSQFVYKASDNYTYLLATKALLGEVSASTINFGTASSPTLANPNTITTPNVPQYEQTTYASISGNTYIKDHPLAKSLTSDAAGSTVVQQTAYTYNGNSGTLATKKTLICTGSSALTSYNSYSTYGLVTSISDPVSVPTIISYDTTYNIYPATTTVGSSPNTLTTTTTYDARSGSLATKTDPMGVFVQNTYDALDRLTESDKTPLQGSAVWMEKASYNLAAITTRGSAVSYEDVTMNDGVGGAEHRTYLDGLGRPIQTRTLAESGTLGTSTTLGPTGNNYYRVVSTAYDGRGNAFLTTWPRFENAITYSLPPSQPAKCIGYDAMGRVNHTWRWVDATFNSAGTYMGNTPDAGNSSSPLNTAGEQWAYVNGTDPWWIIHTDEDGRVRNYQLDAFGRNCQIQEVNGASVYNSLFTYDLSGNLTQIENNNSENIYYGYDDAGKQVAMADPYLGQWTYQRDAAGRLRVQTDARGDVVVYSYINQSGQQDALGRVQQKSVYNSQKDYTGNAPASTATYVYDVNSIDDSTYPVYPGLLYMVTDSQGWEKNGYDTRGRLIINTRHLNINNQSYTTTYGYDDGNNVKSIGYPNSGPTINYAYFTGGSINTVSSSAATYYTVTAGSYDAFGHATDFSYGNGLNTSRTYYSLPNRLESITCSAFNRTFTYTDGDDIASLSGTGLGSGTINVTYDNLHRISSYTGLTGNYVYDSVGTLQTTIESGTATAYNFGNARKQAVKSAFNMTYLYDLCGNMIVRNGAATGSQALAYDGENQLTNFSQAGTVVAQYGYDADGARLWKQLNQDPAQVQVWIGKIYEEKNDQTIQHVKHTLFHVFAGDQQICTFEAGSPLDGGSVSGAIGYYYHEDNISSSSVLSAANAAQLEVDAYYPFGRTETATPQAPFQVSRRFTGQVLDAESGLYYYNARYYDPELGRFIQPDDVIQDLSNPQSYNRYSYCVNDPLRYTDPTGKDFVLNAGLVNGPVPYMTARSTLGQIGASVYNMFPLVDNSIHQVLRGVAAVDHAAGDVLQATTLAVTGDPQLAENSRNLTLLVGGVGELGKIAKVDEAVVTGAKALPDEALVVRGGQNLPQNFSKGSGVSVGENGALNGVSVQSANGVDVKTLSQNIPHNQVGVTTVGDVRAAGGNVVHSPTPGNPHHSTLSGVNANTASDLFRPTIPNPAKQ